MILSDKDIKAQIKKGALKIEPLSLKDIQPASVDIHLDSRFIIFKNYQHALIDVKEKTDNGELVTVEKDGYFIIHPHEFVLGNSVERFTIPSTMVGRLEGRSSIGRLGVIVHATAGFFDPGFSGNATLEMFNISNIAVKLYVNMRIGQMSFEMLSSPADIPYGTVKGRNKYKEQSDPLASMIWQDFNK